MKSIAAFVAVAAAAAATAAVAAPPRVASAPGLVVASGGSIYVAGEQVARGAEPAWSPDGKSIAFARRGELFVLDPKTKEERRVVKRSRGLHWPAKTPAWSPDGKKIAFAGPFDVHVLDLATGKIANLTRSPNSWQANATPAWSPDGRWIAFARHTDPTNSDIFVIATKGGRPPRRLTFTERRADEASPTWSPDGRTIVFVSTRDGNSELYAIGADGTRERRLTRTRIGYDEESPRFSPDGRRILYVHDGRVAHVRRDGGDVRELGLGAAADWR